MKHLYTLLIIAAFFAACKKEKKDEKQNKPVHDTEVPVGGKINGENFAFVSGGAAPQSPGSNIRTLKLYPVALSDSCLGAFTNRITTSIPAMPGTYTYSIGGYSVTFYHEASNTNYIGTTGTVTIDSINNTTQLLYGKMKAKMNNENYYNGSFVLKVCP